MAKYSIGERVKVLGIPAIIISILYAGTKSEDYPHEPLALDHYFIKYDDSNKDSHYAIESWMSSITGGK